MATPVRNPSGLLEVAERLRLTREALGLTQAAIGRLAGISPSAWNNYERARGRIGIEQAIKLCEATGATLDWIYRGVIAKVPYDLATTIRELMAQRA